MYSGFHLDLDPQLGSREHNAATDHHLDHAPFGLINMPLQPEGWGGVYCQIGINPKAKAI